MAMATNSLGMSSIVRGDEKKIELWVHGRNDLYSLEAVKGRQAKEEFAAELRKVIIRQKDQMQKQRNVMYLESASATSEADTQRPSSRLTRSRSLETSKGNKYKNSHATLTILTIFNSYFRSSNFTFEVTRLRC